MKNNNVKYSAEIVNEFLKWQTYSCIMWISLFLIFIILSFLFIGYSKRNFLDAKNEPIIDVSQVQFMCVALVGICVISFHSYRLVHICTAPNHYVLEALNENKCL